MINLLLKLLDLIPYRTRTGLSISTVLKLEYYNFNTKQCLCGGKIITHYHRYSEDCIGWETVCLRCNELFDED